MSFDVTRFSRAVRGVGQVLILRARNHRRTVELGRLLLGNQTPKCAKRFASDGT